ncbi:Hypothetical predicted protein [Paramuricea clavata]|uniref:Uncharacterized protein n=1 Tax=Paramuricea clavata TaxID=317549 RepID=A0A7D9HGC7_PARCT|nr:Hypothetical predicted protein [Paramuricea clavata]
MDLNHKVSFQCPAESLRLPENYKQNSDENDVVDCENFWANVELSMIVHGITRRGKDLYNTEHWKVKIENAKIEEDCREITEERLLELLHQSMLKDTQSLAKKLGLAGKVSKLDIIMNIKNAVQNDEEKFTKAFNKLWGCFGGWTSRMKQETNNLLVILSQVQTTTSACSTGFTKATLKKNGKYCRE